MSEEFVERLAVVDAGDNLWIDTGDVQGWFTVEAEVEIIRPEKHQRGWDEGRMWVYIAIPEEVEDEQGFVYWSGNLRAETEEGEWQEPVAVFPDRWRAGVESIEDAEMPPEDWRGDDRDIETLHVLESDGWRLREEALDAIEKVRSKSVERVVLLDAYVRYVRETGQSDVWYRYEREVEEPSLSDFLEWLEEEDIEELLGEATAMFPQREGVLDVSGRSGWDAVFALQHFRGE